ncbi:uncharacterized protein [Solanum lycopersicum]|uniref:uncharacterized protein n=1 Tax=Solanum lycopersicum TaxID=4081 RepID=UPI00374A4AA5
MACSLRQKGKVIAYASRQLNVQEKNYPIHDLKLAVILFALKIWRHYICGLHCEVLTYHRSLQYIFNSRDLNLRKRRWLDFLKDYYMTILYHLGKTNVVADALSQKAVSMGSLAMLKVIEHLLARDVQSLTISFVRLDISESSKVFAYMGARSSLMENIRAQQFDNGDLCDLTRLIMEKAHSLRYSIHPKTTKMYRDLKQHYRWCLMKRDIVDFVSRCLNCNQVKYEHQKPGDRGTQFTSHFWRSMQKELGAQVDLSTNFHPQTDVNIRPLRWHRLRLCVVGDVDLQLSRQRSYADRKVRDLEFMVGERILLMVSPMKGVMILGKKGKLSSKYIEPFEIVERIGEVAYQLALPPGLISVHPVFHISMLKKYQGGASDSMGFSVTCSEFDF